MTYRIPSDVLGPMSDEEQDASPPSRDVDDLDFASEYLQHQIGLGGTVRIELYTFPYTFRAGFRTFFCVPHVFL